MTTSALASTLLAGGAVAAAESDHPHLARRGQQGLTRQVSYHGLRFRVPPSWRVHDLDAHPSTCVRFDRPAVYLGTPGRDQRCPAHTVGRTEALLVGPRAPDADAGHGPARPGAAPPVSRIADDSGVARLALAGTGLTVTAAYRSRPGLVDQVLETMSYDGPSRPTPVRQPTDRGVAVDPEESTAPDIPRNRTATRARNKGFDTCAAPSTGTMHAWKKSPFRSIGIYVGGINRSCPDGNLGRHWVHRVAKDGWRLLPIFVGRQAPCAFQRDLASIAPSKAGRQGRTAAASAVKRAKRLGLHAGSAIYFDMEGYNDGSTRCRKAVLTFLSAWTRRLHRSGYLSGVYSSAASGIKNLSGAYTSTGYARPDVIWTARWDGEATIWGERYLRRGQWHNHQRAKQYKGPHNETWGGRTINIDRDVVDSAVGSPSYAYRVTADVTLHTRRGPGTSYDVVGTRSPGAKLHVMCQAKGQLVKANPWWDKLTDGSYVSDHYVSTPGGGPEPRCSYPYQVRTDLLRQRSRASTAGDIVGTIRRGGLAYVECQHKGQRISKSRVWDHLHDGSWVSDWYTTAPGRPGFTDPIPRCH